MKNIVVCCDGTGNEISENISNVLKLYRVVRKTSKTQPLQVAFYDPGVGTLARPDPWIKLKQDAITVLGLASGYGLDANVLAAYKFLINNYDDGDAIYLFGFSRGAYTVRVLAALVHKVGLLAPQQQNLADAALTAYKQSAVSELIADGVPTPLHDEDEGAPVPTSKDDRAAQFARIVSARWPTIAFIGVWDTVASIIVPRPDRFYTFSLQELPHTRHNPSVRVFRQAVALDERRRMFRLHPWADPQVFMHNRFSKTNNAEPQDVQQVWFAGVHADIGGGYPEAESGLSKFPLLWMIGEAAAHGLAINQQAVNQLAWGIQRRGSPYTYVDPDFSRDPHKSMTWIWRTIEWLPKSERHKEWGERRCFGGYYVPGCEPRFVPENAWIHESVTRRLREVPHYRPINLPQNYRVAPMNIRPGTGAAHT